MITYKQNPQLDFQAFLDLYASVGWAGYTRHPEMLEKALEHSLLVLAAFDGDRLVGLLRAVGDGHSIVFIQDILVQPISDKELGVSFWSRPLPTFQVFVNSIY